MSENSFCGSRRYQLVGVNAALSRLAPTSPSAPPASEGSRRRSLAKYAHEGSQRRSEDENSQKHNEGDFICSTLGDGAGEPFPAGTVSGSRRALFQNGGR